MSSSLLLVALLLGLSGLVYALRRKYSSEHVLPLPPGPKPLPILGNLFDIPTSHEYETYTRWGKEYSDVVHVSALGQHLLILNSIEAANELLDQRSAIYSDRPHIPMLHDPELMDCGWSFALKPYSTVWKRQRRLFSQQLNSNASRAYFGNQSKATHSLLRSVLSTPQEFEAHIRHVAGEIIMGIAYGYDVKPRADPFIDLAERMSRAVGQGVQPGGYKVNIFPWLKYVPGWFPGAGFKGFAARARTLSHELLQWPFEELKERMHKGTAPPSFSRSALADASFDDCPGELIQDIQEVAATIYAAGADTTVSTLHSCVLALVLNPSVQTRAQAELDAILGPVTSPTSRLPTIEDRPSLPYIECILKESLRWLPVAATGVPHASTKEDVYRGWRIPKGTIIIPNAWSMLHDAKIYHDPLAFRPERFLPSQSKAPDPEPGVSGAFGFGRRACPGRFLAETSLWLEIASTLSVFNFSLAKNEDGRDIDVAYAAVPPAALLVHPQHFPCSITPRSREAETRIQETMTEGDI